MLVLPLPLFVALVLGFLFVQGLLTKNRPLLFSTLLLVCALQNLIVTLAQYYELQAAWKIQPILATCIPPLAWLAFVSASIRPVRPARDWAHALGPVFIVFCMIFAPVTIDAVLISIFIGYGCAMLTSLHIHRDALPLARLETGAIPQKIWICIACALLLSALTDILIATAIQSGSPSWAPKIISAGAAASLFAIGLLTLSPSLETTHSEQEPDENGRSSGQQPSSEDTELVGRLNEMLTSRQLYLDPGLTLSRLALRLGVPAKKLSASVNRATGENVSRYINGHRIRHACTLLERGANVTAAMLDSGFNTKSNFNREFTRVTGKTPSNWKPATFLAEGQRIARLSHRSEREEGGNGKRSSGQDAC